MTPIFLVLRVWKVLIQPPLKSTGHCSWSLERSERKLVGKQVGFQLCSVLFTQWVPYQGGCAPEKGRIIKMSLSSGMPNPQMASFVLHPSPVTLTPVVQKIRLISLGSYCFPLRWHMLCYVAFYIKVFLNSYALIHMFICWKSIMAASSWWKSLLRRTKPYFQFWKINLTI